jgi:hypothetical protein
MCALADDRFRVLERLKARFRSEAGGGESGRPGDRISRHYPIRNLCVVALSEKFFLLSRRAKIT